MESDSNRWFLCVRCQICYKGSPCFLAHKNGCNVKLQRLVQRVSKSSRNSWLNKFFIKSELNKTRMTKGITTILIHKEENSKNGHNLEDSRNQFVMKDEDAREQKLCLPGSQAQSGDKDVNQLKFVMPIMCDNLSETKENQDIFADDAEVKMLSEEAGASMTANSHANLRCEEKSGRRKSQTRIGKGPLRKATKITCYFKSKSSLTLLPITNTTTTTGNMDSESDKEPLGRTMQVLDSAAINDDSTPMDTVTSNDSSLEERLEKKRPLQLRPPPVITATTVANSGKKFYKCNFCPKKFVTSLNLRTHTRTHNGELENCKFGRASFSSRYGDKVHEKAHLGNANYKDCFKHVCSLCGKHFREANQLRQHMLSHTGEKPIVCDQCPKRFATNLGRNVHLMMAHSNVPNVKDTFKFSCSVCSKKFLTLYYLRLHSRIHTGDKPFGCEFCSKKFSQRAHLKAHLLSVHSKKFSSSKSSEKFIYHLNKCPFCSKLFYSKPDLERHVRRHNGEMPFTCRFCPMKFNLAGNRKRHEVWVHYKEMDPEELAKKPKCRCCKRPFYANSEVRIHEKVHLKKLSVA